MKVWVAWLFATYCLLQTSMAWGLSEVHVDFQPTRGTTAAGYVAVTPPGYGVRA